MKLPRLLDLFCGAGGASVGYAQAGFEVVGIDVNAMPRYPYEFIQADALEVLADREFLAGFDAIHASPPCQAYTSLNIINKRPHPELVEPVRDLLTGAGKPWVIENVPGAPLRNPLVLCGTEFGLTTTTKAHGRVWLRRHRLFESNVFLMGAGGCHCYAKLTVPVYGGGAGGNRVNMRGPGVAQAGRDVMGIDWMTRDELDQAIPPAYTQHIGEQLIRALQLEEAS